MIVVNIISYILVLLGAINWGLYGLFDFNLVTAIFSGDLAIGAMIVYGLIAIAAIWLIIYTVFIRGIMHMAGSNRRAHQ